MANCLQNLSFWSTAQQTNLWHKQKSLITRTAGLVKQFGKPAITSAQAKRLDALGFNFESLVKLAGQSSNGMEFMKKLKTRGVNSHPLRQKLANKLKS